MGQLVKARSALRSVRFSSTIHHDHSSQAFDAKGIYLKRDLLQSHAGIIVPEDDPKTQKFQWPIRSVVTAFCGSTAGGRPSLSSERTFSTLMQVQTFRPAGQGLCDTGCTDSGGALEIQICDQEATHSGHAAFCIALNFSEN